MRILSIIFAVLLLSSPVHAAFWVNMGSPVVEGGSSNTISYETSVIDGHDSAQLSCPFTVPATVDDGDMLILTYYDDFTAVTIDSLTGWTALRETDTNSSRQATYYREASSDASVEYEIVTTVSAGGRARITVLSVYSKSGGTWNISNDNGSTSDGDSTLASGSVDTTTGSILHVEYLHDTSATVSTAPTGMTSIGTLIESSTLTAAAYYQSYSSGSSSITKSITWSVSDQVSSNALVLELE
jgi:hypothetical protein